MKIHNNIAKDERLDFNGYEKLLQKNKSLCKKFII